MVLHEKKINNGLWKEAWQEYNFRSKLISGLFILIVLLAIMPSYFQFIENRDGLEINDWVLNAIPAWNASLPIFIIIWLTAALALINAFKNPDMFILLLWSFIFLTISRLFTIYLVPLNPPNQLIALVDPISNRFYGNSFVTKDLFYSGHTSTQFLFFLCFKNKILKTLALIATITIGTLVLVQHVHYTVDVVSAPFFTYLVFKIANSWLSPVFVSERAA